MRNLNGIPHTSIYNRVEQAAFTVLATHNPVPDGADDIAAHIAGFATAAALLYLVV